MQFYRRSESDKITSINRSHFDADQGRIDLALLRLQDLHSDFPNDQIVLYAEGLLRRDYLGEGLKSRELFARSYAQNDHPSETRGFAAFNVMSLARNKEEFYHWADIAAAAAPADPDVRKLREQMDRLLAGGERFAAIAQTQGKLLFEQSRFGLAAAHWEIALSTEDWSLDEGLALRRHRAQSLRKLDWAAAASHKVQSEEFLPPERLALQAALEELERAIALDEYDPELWNFRAAWCFLLNRLDETLTSAERAIALRPQNYAKPWINKAQAFRRMGRGEEMRAAGREAIRQAATSPDSQDVNDAQWLSSHGDDALAANLTADLDLRIREFLKGVTISSRKEVSRPPYQGGWEGLARGVVKRVTTQRIQGDDGYVSLVAELLSDFTPETVFMVALQASRLQPDMCENLCRAALSVAACSTGCQQRDAARMVVIVTLSTNRVAAARRVYRRAVLVPLALDPHNLTGIDLVLQEELGRIAEGLSDAIAKQEPIAESDIESARQSSQASESGFYSANLSGAHDESSRYAGMSTVADLATMLGISEAEAARAVKGARGCTWMVVLLPLGWAVGWGVGYAVGVTWAQWIGLAIGFFIGQYVYHSAAE